jgi:hypothetical protein
MSEQFGQSSAVNSIATQSPVETAQAAEDASQATKNANNKAMIFRGCNMFQPILLLFSSGGRQLPAVRILSQYWQCLKLVGQVQERLSRLGALNAL